ARELLREFRERCFESRPHLVVEDLLFGDAGEHTRRARLEETIEFLLVAAHLLDRYRIEVALRRGVDNRHLFFDLQGLILRLLEDLDETAAAIQLRLRGFVEVAAKLRE